MKKLSFLILVIAIASCNPSDKKTGDESEETSLLEEAVEAYNDSLYAKSIELINEYIQTVDSNDAYPYELLGDVYWEMQDTAVAEKNYLRSLQKGAGTEVHQKIFNLFYPDDLEKSCFYANYRIEKFPDDFEAINNLALCRWENGDTTKAIELFESILKQDKFYDNANFNLGYLYYERENYHEALPYFTRISEEYYDLARTSYCSALCFLNLGDTANGVEALNRTVGLDSEHDDAYTILGDVYYSKGDYGNAVVNYQQANRIDPNYNYYHHNLSLTYLALNDSVNCIYEMKTAWELDTTQTYYGYQLGRMYFEFARFDDAMKMFKAMVATDSKWSEPVNGIGNVYFAKNDFKKAKEYYLRASKISPKYAAPLYNLAIIANNENKKAEAIKYMNKVVELEPSNREYKDFLKGLKK